MTTKKGNMENPEKKKRIENFIQLLNSLDKLDDKRRLLWCDIYQNAIDDRDRAGVLYTNVMTVMENSIVNHSTVGPTIVKYLERMSKSNEQILKLAEMVLNVDESNRGIDSDSLYAGMED